MQQGEQIHHSNSNNNNNMHEHVVDESAGPYFPFNRRETYPRRLKVDFRRLPTNTLLQYTAHHDLHIRPDSTHDELAIAAARHFAAWRINEDAIMRSFCAGLATSTIGTPRRGLGDDERAEADRKRKRLDSLDFPDVVPSSPERGGDGGGGSTVRSYAASSSSVSSTPPRGRNRNASSPHGGGGSSRDSNNSSSNGPTSSSERRSRYEHDDHVFETAEQEPGLPPRAWILARVVQQKKHGKVELHDEDDPSHVFDLPVSNVMHLEDFSSELRKHEKVLAVFPDTTIFYCATVAKDTPRMEGNSKMVLVYFEDDEDVDGRCQSRRIPAEHIIIENRHYRYGNEGAGGGRSNGNGGGGGRSGGRGVKAGVSSRGTGVGRSRSTSPRVRSEYGGGGAAGNHLQGGAASLGSGGGGGGRASNSNSDQPQEKGNKKGGATYADMIAHALSKVEGGKGPFTQICNIIEAQFSDYLNWKLESDVRKTPVWKSSVRKILFSNSRFQHHSTTPELGHVFVMANNKK
ncbi:unnamed protein product [Pylaiella littoralis]